MSQVPALNWRASESCVTEPAPTSERCLEGVMFRLRESEEPSCSGVAHIQQNQDWESCRPELFLGVDVRALVSDSGVTRESLVIAVILRDRILGRFKQVAEWALDRIPADAWQLPLDHFSWSTQLDVAVLAALSGPSTTNSRTEEATRGTILARKIFKIRPPSEAFEFPIKQVSPADMEKEGVSSETALYVHWKGADLNRPPTDLIEIWLNKQFEDKFRALSVKRPVPAAKYIGLGFTAQVYADILAPILSSNEEATEENGLLWAAKNLVESTLARDLEELRTTYQEEPAGRSKLLPWCWKLARADRAFSQLTFQ